MDSSCVCVTPSFTIMSSCTVLMVNVSVHIHLLLTVDHTSIILHVCNVYVTSSLMMLLSLHSQDQINMSPSVTDFYKKISSEENRNKQILITSHTCVVHVSLCFGWSHVTVMWSAQTWSPFQISISPILSDGWTQLDGRTPALLRTWTL